MAGRQQHGVPRNAKGGTFSSPEANRTSSPPRLNQSLEKARPAKMNATLSSSEHSGRNSCSSPSVPVHVGDQPWSQLPPCTLEISLMALPTNFLVSALIRPSCFQSCDGWMGRPGRQTGWQVKHGAGSFIIEPSCFSFMTTRSNHQGTWRVP